MMVYMIHVQKPWHRMKGFRIHIHKLCIINYDLYFSNMIYYHSVYTYVIYVDTWGYNGLHTIVIVMIIIVIIEGSLEAKLPTIWKDGNGTARKKLGRGES